MASPSPTATRSRAAARAGFAAFTSGKSPAPGLAPGAPTAAASRWRAAGFFPYSFLRTSPGDLRTYSLTVSYAGSPKVKKAMARCSAPDPDPCTWPRSLHRLAFALLVVLTALPAVEAKRSDVVVLRNGDRITGEVKELAYGQLEFKTDDMGTLYIEWTKIATLTTTQVLQVELADGQRVFGPAPERGSDTGALRLVGGTSGNAPETPVEVPMASVVRLSTIVNDAWYRRLDGDLSLGYSFTNANAVETFNVSASVGSRTRIRRWNVDYDGQQTSQDVGPPTMRRSLVLSLERYLPKNYYYEGILGFGQNDELGLKLRSLIGGTFGRYMVQNQITEWRIGAGLAASTETSTDDSRRNGLEALLNTSLRIFRLDSPKVDVNAGLSLLPSLSDSGRLRGEGSLQLRRELVSDLFFEISLYDSFDNRPSEGFASNDWSVSTSLGYSF